MKYARPVDFSETHDGSNIRLVDVFDASVYEPRPSWGQTDDELLSRIFANHKSEWVNSGEWFIAVPDDVMPGGAVSNGDGTYANPTAPPVSSGPNNPNNPYFGKTPKPIGTFWALIGAVMSADRQKRLISDSHFIWVQKVLEKVDIVDVDDKNGQFVGIVHYLTTTLGDDGRVLMDPQELTAIMTAWK